MADAGVIILSFKAVKELVANGTIVKTAWDAGKAATTELSQVEKDRLTNFIDSPN